MLPDTTPLLEFQMQLRSRYSETDKMGVIYHSRFLEYFEVIRTEFIRAAGLPYRQMEESGIMLPVSEVRVRYKRPILYDELMNTRLIIFDQPEVKLVTYYKIFSAGSFQPSVEGKVVLVFMDVHSRRPTRVPRIFLEKINKYAQLA